MVDLADMEDCIRASMFDEWEPLACKLENGDYLSQKARDLIAQKLKGTLPPPGSGNTRTYENWNRDLKVVSAVIFLRSGGYDGTQWYEKDAVTFVADLYGLTVRNVRRIVSDRNRERGSSARKGGRRKPI